MQRKILRYILATAGAIVITGSMLILMGEFAAMFRARNGDQIFLINDILPAPERGRPVRPPAAVLPPQRDVTPLDRHETTLDVERLDEPDAPTIESAPAIPNLDEVEREPE